jgi:hypothetical protein
VSSVYVGSRISLDCSSSQNFLMEEIFYFTFNWRDSSANSMTKKYFGKATKMFQKQLNVEACFENLVAI